MSINKIYGCFLSLFHIFIIEITTGTIRSLRTGSPDRGDLSVGCILVIAILCELVPAICLFKVVSDCKNKSALAQILSPLLYSICIALISIVLMIIIAVLYMIITSVPLYAALAIIIAVVGICAMGAGPVAGVILVIFRK